MGIYQKLYDVMNETEALEKNMTVGSGSNAYRAVSEKEVLNMLKPLFKKHKLIVIPKDGDIQETNITWEENYKGEISTKKRNVTLLKTYFEIIDIETGEKERIAGFGNGADSQDKGAGKAFTYAFKNALIKTFMLFSGEDTDNTHSDDIGNPTPKSDKPKADVKVTTQMLEDMAKTVGVPLIQLIERYTEETNKSCTEIKFISQDKKQQYYDELSKLVRK